MIETSSTAAQPAAITLPRVIKEYVFIDWLRGGAALLVVLFHFDLHIFTGFPVHPVVANSWTDWFVFGRIDLGKMAVGVFFMVSGFLIPSTLRGPRASLRAYGIHRVFRLYPSYWVSLLVFMAIAFGLHEVKFSAAQVAVNATMLQRFVGMGDLIGVYWTLQIELIFYVLCAGLFLAGFLQHRIRIFAGCLAGAVLLAAARHHTGKDLPVALLIALSLMFLGDAIRARCDGRMAAGTLAKLVVVMLLALLPICLLAYDQAWLRYVASYWIAMGVFLFAAVVPLPGTPLPWLTSLRIFLANCSYSIYLLHDPIGMNLARYLFRSTASAWFAGVCGLAATLAAAHVVFRLVELPCIRLGRRLSRPPMPVAEL